MSEILKVSSVSKTYKTEHGPLKVLDDVSFSVHKGSWTMLIGASGSGKTTLLQLLGALDKPDVGTIQLSGSDYAKAGSFASAKTRREKLGFVFQSFNLLPELTAIENIMLPGLFKSSDKKAVKARAEELLAKLNLSDRATHKPNALSGGEQQRIAIARSLINDPEVILADEPTGNLDPSTSDVIIDIFKGLIKDQGKTIVMVTHDHALKVHASKVLQLDKGRIVKRA
ncbi:MAG: ABC transporter ATP-binding protein [Lentisphaeraceae bacterium]|nr:ABC transporter ATP-binding protein [Lentisphaeraceae bacterium]